VLLHFPDQLSHSYGDAFVAVVTEHAERRAPTKIPTKAKPATAETAPQQLKATEMFRFF